MATPLQQASFVAGELAPALHGRTDIDRYAQGAKLLKNFVVRPHGGIYNRAGSLFRAVTKNGKQGTTLPPARCYRFSPRSDLAYILEFGEQYLRFYVDGAQILTTTPVEPYELVTPYSADDVMDLQFAASVDVLRITHGNYFARVLKHVDATTWTLDYENVITSIAYPTGVLVPPLSVGTVRDWEYMVSSVMNDGTETEPVSSGVVHTGSTDQFPQPVYITRPLLFSSEVDHYNVYKGLEGIYGFIGQVRNTSPSPPAFPNAVVFNDHNYAPDYTDQPVKLDNPFKDGGTLKPRCVAYFDQRLVFANFGAAAADTIEMSEVGNYGTFTKYVPAQPDDSIRVTLAAQKLDDIKALLPLDNLLVFTAGAEHVLSGGQSPLTAATVQAPAVSHRGSFGIPPLVLGNVVIFYDRARRVREFLYDQSTNGYPAENLTTLASHLFTGRTIVDWCVTEDPEQVLWAALDDGTLVSLTYLREHNVAAWCRHDTQGRVISLCSVPGDDGDDVWMIVNRQNGEAPYPLRQFVETMPARKVTSAFLDAAIAVSGRTSVGQVQLSGGADWVPGEVIVASMVPYSLDPGDGAGAPAGPGSFGYYALFSPADVGTELVVPAPDGTSARGRIVTVQSDLASASIELLEPVPASIQVVPVSGWAIARSYWRGFDHLIGQTVRATVDGEPHDPIVVDVFGGVTLDHAGVDVAVGLTYVSEFRSLEIAVKDQDIRSRVKSVDRVHLDLLETQGLEVGEQPEGGQDETLYALKQDYPDDPSPITGLREIGISGSWNKGGGIIVRQSDPLPCEILSVSPQVTLGG